MGEKVLFASQKKVDYFLISTFVLQWTSDFLKKALLLMCDCFACIYVSVLLVGLQLTEARRERALGPLEV